MPSGEDDADGHKHQAQQGHDRNRLLVPEVVAGYDHENGQAPKHHELRESLGGGEEEIEGIISSNQDSIGVRDRNIRHDS